MEQVLPPFLVTFPCQKWGQGLKWEWRGETTHKHLEIPENKTGGKAQGKVQNKTEEEGTSGTHCHRF